MSESRGPVRSFWNAALLIFGACLLLWFAVQMIASVWLWLLLGAAVALLGWGVWQWWRWRRSRW